MLFLNIDYFLECLTVNTTVANQIAVRVGNLKVWWCFIFFSNEEVEDYFQVSENKAKEFEKLMENELDCRIFEIEKSFSNYNNDLILSKPLKEVRFDCQKDDEKGFDFLIYNIRCS